MVELFALCRSRVVVALALFFAVITAFPSSASARSHRHHHSVERHAHVHHASRYAGRHHHSRHYARASRFERGAAQLQARGFADTQASYGPDTGAGGAAVSGGGSTLVMEARHYLGGNPTGRGSLWCARFMNMVLQRTGHHGTGSDMASSFAHYGQRISGPQVGAIAVMGRRGGGHVGIITGIDAHGNPVMISGNNGNRVREAPVSRGRIYAYVMPN